MKASSTTDKKELAELPKLIKRRKIAGVRKYSIEKIDHPVNHGISLKTVKVNLPIGENLMYAVRNKEGNFITNMNRIVEAVEEIYR